MKVRPFYELTWKNSKDRENYERQGNFDTIASFEMWGTCNGKSMNIKKIRLFILHRLKQETQILIFILLL